MPSAPSWTDVLTLRPEVVASDGGVGELQMSLHKAVYQTVDVPYRVVDYYADITQPTPNLVGFLARVARRLGGAGEPVALFHLDQGMGGGKSHALVGLYHMASNPGGFFATDVGSAVLGEAQADGGSVNLTGTRIVTLTADHFSPRKPGELFGPATSLFERFLWAVVAGDRSRWDALVAQGPNKTTLQRALSEVGGPVLILLDELMDYVLQLSDASVIDSMPGEQAFLNSLMDACDDVPHVAFVVVMIRSELDPEGYTPAAEDFRDYVARRLNRNGTTIAVTETADFASIIRRRIFERTTIAPPAGQLAEGYQETLRADPGWASQVLDRLGPGRGAAGLVKRIAAAYPFHPDLMDLVQNEWGKTQGFQRVRSTVAIFALAALHWSRIAQAGAWVPPLIGVGDLPLAGISGAGLVPQARCLDALLNSGLLLGNDRAIQGYRAVATTDISSADGTSGRAVELDRRLAEAKVSAGQPSPATRMATALFCYSLVGRTQGRRGATKAELMAALLLPADETASAFSAVEEVFWAVTGEEGLGALEVTKPANAPERFWLTIKQTIRMFFNSVRGQVSEDDKNALVWQSAQSLASKGQFEEIVFVAAPVGNQLLVDVAGHIDAQANRIVVLDPSRWTLLNGEDNRTRSDIRQMFGLGVGALLVDNAASLVIVAVNTYQRRYSMQAAEEVLTWRLVLDRVGEEDERADVERKLLGAESKLKEKVRLAYRHYSYLTRHGDDLEVVFARFDDDKLTSLSGNDVWGALVGAGRAIGEYFDSAEKRRKRVSLSEVYLAALLDGFDRHLTLKDVASSFYKNPQFPVVPSIDEIRRVVFDLIQAVGHDGDGTGGWELVDGSGVRFTPDSPGQLAINSIQQQLRRARPAPGSGPELQEDPGADGIQGQTQATRPDSQPTARPAESGLARRDPAQSAPTTFSWYRLDVTNRSITDDAKRDEIRKALLWLASKLDDDSLDHQLITIKYEMLAATSDLLADDLAQRAVLLDARCQVEADD
jgi:Protein of unknown function (DUF499)